MLEYGDKEISGVVRAHDPDRYISALLAPRDAVRHLMTLYAFNVELARIGGNVSEPALGEIRLQWWRETLEEAAAGNETGHLVADAMGATIRQFSLPKYEIHGLIDARVFDLGEGEMPDAHGLNAYLMKTDGAVVRLAYTLLGGATTEDSNDLSRLFARSYGFAQILRTLPLSLMRGFMPLGRYELMLRGIRPEDMFLHNVKDGRAEVKEGWAEAIDEFCGDIRRNYKTARLGLKKVPNSLRAAFLPLALTEALLTLVQQRRADLEVRLELHPFERVWRLWRARCTGRF